MGYTKDVYAAGACHTSWTRDCYMLPIPSGPDVDRKTKIYGEQWASGCSTKPELWAAGDLHYVLNLNGSSNVDLQCLDVTDHDKCGGSYTGYKCATGPASLAGRVGLYGYNGSNNSLTNVDIHGFAYRGMYLGKQANFSATDVSVIGNASAGIDQDTPGNVDDSWSGTNTFTRVRINWNGCSENYPADGRYVGCTDQNDTGYGDGWGSPDGGTGGSFTFVGGEFKYNTSDALDLLYSTDKGAAITVDRMHFEGNVGQAVKIGAGTIRITNSVVIANCNYWRGKPFTAPHFVPCRAGGNPIVVVMNQSDSLDIINNSITGESDILIAVAKCTGGGKINVRNNVLYGWEQWGGVDQASWYYGYDGCSSKPDSSTTTHNLIFNVKETSACSAYSNCLQADPRFWSIDYIKDSFDLRLQAGSPAIGAGLAIGTVVGQTKVPSVDFNGVARGDTKVLGAFGHIK